jgi:hypothetical protein
VAVVEVAKMFMTATWRIALPDNLDMMVTELVVRGERTAKAVELGRTHGRELAEVVCWVQVIAFRMLQEVRPLQMAVSVVTGKPDRLAVSGVAGKQARSHPAEVVAVATPAEVAEPITGVMAMVVVAALMRPALIS